MRRALFNLGVAACRRIASPPPAAAAEVSLLIPAAAGSLYLRRTFSNSGDSAIAAADSPPPPLPPAGVDDVSNEEFKRRLEKYFEQDDESGLEAVVEAVFARTLHGTHEDTDKKLVRELQAKPLPEINERDFESDFEEMYETDEELDNLLGAKRYVDKKLARDEFFNMNDEKRDKILQKVMKKGTAEHTKAREGMVQNMLGYEKLIPDEIKEMIEAKFNELGEMCNRGELETDQAYKIFKEFEDQMVLECAKLKEAEKPSEDDELLDAMKCFGLDCQSSNGPTFRWEQTVVLRPGGDQCHPKNRKVKLSVTVKELGLSKFASRRLRELVGKRYNSGKDELTITSERFERREENRKDCLRTLHSLIEEAKKADMLVEKARVSFFKEKLKSDHQFMERLKAKVAKQQESRHAAVSG